MESHPITAQQTGARAREWAKLAALSAPQVVIVGGGVNGIGTLRDLGLNGISAVLLETGDFCAGASGASSRMAHGGLRYLEGREFRLVAEAARERNLLLQDAPHLVKPLEIVVPMAELISGLPLAVLRFLGLSSRPGPLSLAALAGALVLYERFGAVRQRCRDSAWPCYQQSFPPGLPQRMRAVVSYFDGQILRPEALVMEMLGEACANTSIAAINHVDWRPSPRPRHAEGDRPRAATAQPCARRSSSCPRCCRSTG
ncbi:MAG: FAD-dependent oxidoreductase [Gemmobacter sp.]|nr:FAD-dependent oxidoreductase [Gemmobacter sp.]